MSKTKTKLSISKLKNVDDILSGATMKKKKKQIEVFTDGACKNNGKPNAVAGIGIHFPNGELDDISRAFTEEPITNQRAELSAIYHALKEIRRKFGLDDITVLIKTDSDYSIKCSSVWPKGWEKNGWKTAAGNSVKNLDIIVKIHHYVQKYDIKFEHVSAHTGGTDYDSVHNHIADQLAVAPTLGLTGGKGVGVGVGAGSKTSAKNPNLITVEKLQDEDSSAKKPSTKTSLKASASISTIKSTAKPSSSKLPNIKSGYSTFGTKGSTTKGLITKGSITKGSSGSKSASSFGSADTYRNYTSDVYKSNVSHNHKVKVDLLVN
jgi:ribonuclease HI